MACQHLTAIALCSLFSLLPVTRLTASQPRQSAVQQPQEREAVSHSPLSLRSYAQSRNFYLGAAAKTSGLSQDEQYGDYLAREFNLLTAEWEMKFRQLQPERDRFNFTAADQLIHFAIANDMAVRGHVLVWHSALPKWLTEGDWTREEAMAILETHIKTVVGRYRGQIAAWDVVNEAITADGELRDSFWLREIGPDYIELAFRWAKEADPNALLFYNDFGNEGLGRKADAIYQFVQDWQAKDIPIDGVGLQMHVAANSPPNPDHVAQNMQRFAALGLAVHITEMDVRLKQPVATQDYQTQAEIYQAMLRTCLQADNCNTFITWGFSDRHSWIPSYFEGWGEALLFTRDYAAKPAYYRLLAELANLSP
ncbi:MAG: endo-1,4-beta-xylanase [Kamptonema sp. SIO4C4]|nr:endo-1,4-beta-xylanase [Kamptonema sp. SIO4C4]